MRSQWVWYHDCMTKRAIISEIMRLAPVDRSEILSLLREVVDEEGALTLAPDQMRELDRRIDEFERLGSRGEPANKVFASLISDLKNAPRNHH